MRQTARDVKDVPPLLAGAFSRSILLGTRYPQSLLSGVIRRIRADRMINYFRAALIKAILMRNYNLEVPVMLDENRPDVGYQLGRLFAVLEKAQEDAHGKVNATIKDRYFGAASTTPQSVFPQLLRLSQHHLRKLEGGRKVNAERMLQSIIGRMEKFPRILDLEGQGEFAIGYYHQRLDFFTPRSEREKRETARIAQS